METELVGSTTTYCYDHSALRALLEQGLVLELGLELVLELVLEFDGASAAGGQHGDLAIVGTG